MSSMGSFGRANAGKRLTLVVIVNASGSRQSKDMHNTPGFKSHVGIYKYVENDK